MPRRLDVFSLPPPPSPLMKPLAEAHENGSVSGSSSSSKDMNHTLLMIALILLLVLIVSVFLHLLLRYLNRYCRSSSDNYVETVSSRRVSPEDQTLFDSLPLFSFNSVTGPHTSSIADCAVCLSKFDPHDQLRLLPVCCHAFHAQCIDKWLTLNYTCPLCRSTILVGESDGSLKLPTSSVAGDSFRVEIGSVSHRRQASDSGEFRRSYSMGSFDYVVDEQFEVVVGPTHQRGVSDCSLSGKEKDVEPSPENLTAPEPPGSEVSGGRGWLKDYVDKLTASDSSSLSSRALSFRFSGRIFAGSSRRSDVGIAGIGFQRNSLRINAVAKKWEPTKVVPQADRVLIRLEELPQKSAGGVLLPNSAVKFERYLMGEILSVGVEVGEVEAGKKVLFSDINAYEVDLGTDARHCFCRASDLLALVE
ncbi:hypothetical protein HHK36_000472 [Tetracentron sinense]|uniref:RING-type domain-containing protein n=1 Tax=Tetracentron sinense TaxID=13715 RepID=A0A834ZRZ4_TETSI|nr:hypothetical protein HHK36_000472 [Tetracentron sinense]